MDYQQEKKKAPERDILAKEARKAAEIMREALALDAATSGRTNDEEHRRRAD